MNSSFVSQANKIAWSLILTATPGNGVKNLMSVFRKCMELVVVLKDIEPIGTNNQPYHYPLMLCLSKTIK